MMISAGLAGAMLGNQPHPAPGIQLSLRQGEYIGDR
jgi:hypothetical protein